MRIISGNFKGRKLIEPIDKKTRPLKDLTKESIFNILEHSNLVKTKINNSKVLDLFAGTGSFGLECISRGSSNVTFVENYKEILLKTSLMILIYKFIILKLIFIIFSMLNNENKPVSKY